jgi:hypothetical protein
MSDSRFATTVRCVLRVTVLNSNVQALDHYVCSEEFTTEFTEGHGGMTQENSISWIPLCTSVNSESLC